MEELTDKFAGVSEFKADILENEFKSYLAEKQIGMGAALPILRVLITGQGTGPGLFEIMELLGREEVLERLKTGLKKVLEWA